MTTCTKCRREPAIGTTVRTRAGEAAWCRLCRRRSGAALYRKAHFRSRATMLAPPGEVCAHPGCTRRQAPVWLSKAASTPEHLRPLCAPHRTSGKVAEARRAGAATRKAAA